MLSISVSAFSLSSEYSDVEVCAGSTEVVDTLVEGVGSFSVMMSGDAKTFTTTVPQDFDSSGLQNVYSYITPPSKTSFGVYPLNVYVLSGGEEKVQEYNVEVKDEHNVRYSAIRARNTPRCTGQS